MNWLGNWFSGKAGTEYIGTSPYRTLADSSQTPPHQDPDKKEDNEVQGILDTTKTRKQFTHKALEKALFSEQVHKMKEPHLEKMGAPHPYARPTWKNQKDRGSPGVHITR